MNIVTVADIKRGGFSVLEDALSRGPVHLMKRNRPSAVLLKPEEYESLLHRANQYNAPSRKGLNLFLAAPVPADGGLDTVVMEKRIADLDRAWQSNLQR